MRLEDFTNLMKMITMALLVLGMVAYGFILFLSAVGQPNASALVGNWPPKAFDILMVAISAFGIVSFLGGIKKESELEFKAFSLEFTGPAVPATLWVVVVLSIVVSFTF